MKKFRALSLILFFCLIFTVISPAALALDEPNVVASSVVLADLNSDRIIYSKNMDTQVAPASLTKIMTVLLAVESVERGEHTMEELITAYDDCRVGMDEMSSTSGIYPGEILSLEDLIYCAMLDSANEACNIIAEYLDGSIAAFVERMNARAAELGMTGTHFANTNGLTDGSHYTTAYDFYILSKEAIRHPAFMTVCNTATYTTAASNVSAPRNLNNSNALISTGSIYGSGYFYEYAAGIKTGYTSAAGSCLISTAEKDGVHVLLVVMGSTCPLNDANRTDYGNFTDSLSIYHWVFDNFSYRTVMRVSDLAAKVNVQMAANADATVLHPVSDVTLLVPTDVPDDAVSYSVTVNEDMLVAPIAAGTVLGQAEIFVAGESFGRVDLVNTSDVELSRTEYMKQHLHSILSKSWVKVLAIVVAVLVFLYCVLVIRYRALRRKHLKAKKLNEKRRREAWEQQYASHHGGSTKEPTQRFGSNEFTMKKK